MLTGNTIGTIRTHEYVENIFLNDAYERPAPGNRGFLAERLTPPLFDARDALGFDPPHVDAARQRIEMAITAIDGELEKSNE